MQQSVIVINIPHKLWMMFCSAYSFQVEINKQKARCRSIRIYWCKVHLEPNSEIEASVANPKKENFWRRGRRLLWFGLFPFLFAIQLFECAGQVRISCYTLEALRDALVQNTSLLWSSLLTDDDQFVVMYQYNWCWALKCLDVYVYF